MVFVFDQHECNSNWLAREVHKVHIVSPHGLLEQDYCSDIQTDLKFGPFLKVSF